MTSRGTEYNIKGLKRKMKMDEETDLEEDQEPKQQEYMRHPFQNVPKPKSTIPTRKDPMDIMKDKGKKIHGTKC